MPQNGPNGYIYQEDNEGGHHQRNQTMGNFVPRAQKTRTADEGGMVQVGSQQMVSH